MADKLELKPWDVTEYLDSEEMIADYLAVAFEEGDSELIRVALNDVARARGMTDLQKQTGLSRSALYKALGEGGNPTLDTLLAILKALGVKMSVVGGTLNDSGELVEPRFSSREVVELRSPFGSTGSGRTDRG